MRDMFVSEMWTRRDNGAGSAGAARTESGCARYARGGAMAGATATPSAESSRTAQACGADGGETATTSTTRPGPATQRAGQSAMSALPAGQPGLAWGSPTGQQPSSPTVAIAASGGGAIAAANMGPGRPATRASDRTMPTTVSTRRFTSRAYTPGRCKPSGPARRSAPTPPLPPAEDSPPHLARAAQPLLCWYLAAAGEICHLGLNRTGLLSNWRPLRDGLPAGISGRWRTKRPATGETGRCRGSPGEGRAGSAAAAASL